MGRRSVRRRLEMRVRRLRAADFAQGDGLVAIWRGARHAVPLPRKGYGFYLALTPFSLSAA